MVGSFIETDLTAILDVGDFAVNASWVEGIRTIQGIFEDSDIEVDRPDGMRHIQRTVTFQTKSSYSIPDEDRLIINSAEYRIVKQEQDGTGITMMLLEKIQ